MTLSIRVVDPATLFVAVVEFEGVDVAAAGRALEAGPQGGVVMIHLPPQHYAEPSVPLGLDSTNLDSVGVNNGFHALVVPLLAGPGTRLVYPIAAGATIDIGDAPGSFFAAIASPSNQSPESTVDVIARSRFTAPPLLWSAVGGDDPETPIWSADAPAGDSTLAAVDWTGDQPSLEALIVNVREGVSTDILRGTLGISPIDLYGPGMPYQGSYRARGLTLTPLGATTDLEQAPDGDPPTYEHRTSVGRDVSVRRTFAGRLSPGNRASLNVRSRRIIRGTALGRIPVTATMLTEAELVIIEPEIDLGALAAEYPCGGREMPFVRLRLLADRLPVDVPAGLADGSLSTAFLVTSRGQPLIVDAIGIDREGREAHLRLPLAFLADGGSVDSMSAALAAAPAAGIDRTQVALAPSDGLAPGSTSVTIASVSFAPVIGARSGIPLLRLDQFEVVVDALEGIGPPLAPVSARLDDAYLSHGFPSDQNPAAAFATLEREVGLTLPTELIGGLGNPGGAVDALTAKAGAVARGLLPVNPSPADLQAAVARAFPSAKLFGRIDLLKLIDPSSFLPTGGVPNLPKLIRTGMPGKELLEYRFECRLQGEAGGARTGPRSRLALQASIDLSTGSPRASSRGTVTDLTFSLAGLVSIHFAQVTFATDVGGKTAFGVEGVDVTFGKALEFLASIAEKLASIGSGSGVRVDLDTSGVTAGFEVAVPTIAMGVVQLSNLSIGAFLRVPFTDAPLSFSLEVSKRERPFLATVSMFGGGGFLALEVTPDGIASIEAAVEFGGSVSLDIIVASGGVSVMAGIYFSKSGTDMAVSGYVRAAGHLSVLGIVSVFVEFYMKLTYAKVGGQAVFAGSASLTVGIRVLFFSKSVTLTVERSFAGSPADPSFTDTFDREDWGEYCRAFASGAPRAVPDPFGLGGGGR
jgi:hypothetical protein